MKAWIGGTTLSGPVHKEFADHCCRELGIPTVALITVLAFLLIRLCSLFAGLCQHSPGKADLIALFNSMHGVK